MLKELKKRALRGLLDKLLDGHAERRPLETPRTDPCQSGRSRRPLQPSSAPPPCPERGALPCSSLSLIPLIPGYKVFLHLR